MQSKKINFIGAQKYFLEKSKIFGNVVKWAHFYVTKNLENKIFKLTFLK